MSDNSKELIDAINRLTDTLDKQSKPASTTTNMDAPAYVYEPSSNTVKAVAKISAPPLHLLLGVERVKNTLVENTHRFAKGYSANNALLWGARGMGKSTLVKAIIADLAGTYKDKPPALVEIHREDIASLPALLTQLRGLNRLFVLYCDDLSFNQPDRDFKALKSVLEGGLEGRPENVIFYATSNRRHLLPRQMADQESAIGIHPNESMDETIALSDRFGLWLGFHPCDQKDYLAMIEGYCREFDIQPEDTWQHAALEWSKTRGNRSGRTAWQFTMNLAGEMGKKISF